MTQGITMIEYKILYTTHQGGTGSMVLSARSIVEAAEMAEAVQQGLPEMIHEITEIREKEVSDG
jgi:hypothetical protein